MEKNFMQSFILLFSFTKYIQRTVEHYFKNSCMCGNHRKMIIVH